MMQTTITKMPGKRLSVTGDKIEKMNHLRSISNSSFLNFDDELNYLNKLEITEGNFLSFFEHKKNVIQNEADKRRIYLEGLDKEVERVSQLSFDLKKKLLELEIQFEHLNTEFKKCNEMKQKYHSDIIKLRRENTKEFDNKLNTLNKQDKNLKLLKKELFLLINLLKLRVVNLDSIDEDNFIKGYLIDIEKNTIKYIEANEHEEALYNCIKFWSAMKELLTGTNASNAFYVNKENLGNVNNLK